ncbi:MAG TPA: 16S rRNA (guanine(527)-N(7))-methyltransferase RsmG [Candidatus Kryptonia bacterium]
MKDISWFVSICEQNGLSINRHQADQFEKYRDLLLSWNANLNLISRKDELNFYSNHILNSISFLFLTRLKSDARLVDLGTGGGLPGIPLKIIYPDMEILLIDSISKKTAAVSDIVGKMGLSSVKVVNARAEEVARAREFQGHFDYVVSRAAGKLDQVIKWSRGFLRELEMLETGFVPGGTALVLKGGDFKGELLHSRNLKYVESVEVVDIIFKGMDQITNVDKKLVLVNLKSNTTVSRRKY